MSHRALTSTGLIYLCTKILDEGACSAFGKKYIRRESSKEIEMVVLVVLTTISATVASVISITLSCSTQKFLPRLDLHHSVRVDLVAFRSFLDPVVSLEEAYPTLLDDGPQRSVGWVGCGNFAEQRSILVIDHHGALFEMVGLEFFDRGRRHLDLHHKVGTVHSDSGVLLDPQVSVLKPKYA